MASTLANEALWRSIGAGVVKSSHYETALGFNMVRIRPNFDKWLLRDAGFDYKEKVDYVFTGLMTEPFSYKLTSDWSSSDLALDLVNDAISDASVQAGGGELGQAYKKKKFWKASGDVSMEISVRVIDVNGTGLPRAVANLFMRWSTAGEPEGIAKSIKAGENSLINVKKMVETKAGVFMENLAPDGASTDTINSNEDVRNGVLGYGGGYTTSLLEDISDQFTLKISPPPLMVEIGRVFEHKDMVLTNVSLSYSPEVHENGPMYMDMTLSLSTRTIIRNIGDIGFKQKVHVKQKDGTAPVTNSANILLKGDTITSADKQKVDPNNPKNDLTDETLQQAVIDSKVAADKEKAVAEAEVAEEEVVETELTEEKKEFIEAHVH